MNLIKSNAASSRKALLAILWLFLLTLLLRVILIFYYNPNYGGIDLNVIYGIQQIVAGNPLYQNPEQPPYAIMQYTPLFYHTVAWVAGIAGISADQVQGIYIIARSCALLFNLLTVLLVAAFLYRQGLSGKRSLLFSLPVLMILTTHYYVRCDSMHLFFFTASLYLMTVWLQKKSFFLLLLMGLSTALCILSKQSGVLVAGIISLYMLVGGKKIIPAFVYGSVVLLSGFFLLRVSIDNDWLAFYQNAVLGLKNGTSLAFLSDMFFSRFFTELIPFYVLGAMMAYTAWKEKAAGTSFVFIVWAAVLSFSFAAITGLKIGSSNNYFVEYLVCCIMAFPLFLKTSLAGQMRFPYLGSITAIRFAWIALFILIGSKTMGMFTSMYIEKRMVSDPDSYRRAEALHLYMRDSLGIRSGSYVYINQRGFTDNIFYREALMPTKDVISQVALAHPETYQYLSFLSGMNSGLIQYVVTSPDREDINAFQPEIPFVVLDSHAFRRREEKYGFYIYEYTGFSGIDERGESFE